MAPPCSDTGLGLDVLRAYVRACLRVCRTNNHKQKPPTAQLNRQRRTKGQDRALSRKWVQCRARHGSTSTSTWAMDIMGNRLGWAGLGVAGVGWCWAWALRD